MPNTKPDLGLILYQQEKLMMLDKASECAKLNTRKRK